MPFLPSSATLSSPFLLLLLLLLLSLLCCAMVCWKLAALSWLALSVWASPLVLSVATWSLNTSGL
jgi:hypothetical protein